MSLTREQLALIAQATAPVKVAKSKQAKVMRSRKGYVRALPIGPLTPKAGESRWALLDKGTAKSERRNVCQLDAKHKPVLGDRRLMRDVANVNDEDLLYAIPEGLDLAGLLGELYRVIRLKLEREQDTRHEFYGRGCVAGLRHQITRKDSRELKFCYERGYMDRVAALIQKYVNLNQVKV
jgi:hypothetical protein